MTKEKKIINLKSGNLLYQFYLNIEIGQIEIVKMLFPVSTGWELRWFFVVLYFKLDQNSLVHRNSWIYW